MRVYTRKMIVTSVIRGVEGRETRRTKRIMAQTFLGDLARISSLVATVPPDMNGKYWCAAICDLYFGREKRM